jgi:hypothetical protein
MRGLLIASAAALVLTVSPAMADQETAETDWDDVLSEHTVISGDEIRERFSHVEEELAEEGAEPHPPYVVSGED